jgi:hypothetical protein
MIAGKRHWGMQALRSGVCAAVWCLGILLSPSSLAHATPKNFASPDQAIAALVEAVKANDQVKLRAILGRDGSKLMRTGDPDADRQNREAFVNAYGEGSKHVMNGEAQAVVVIGKDDWPLPIPLVKTGGGWHFDARQGEQEIRNRHVGRNELNAIQVCLAIVDAEREYATADADGDGMLEYAPRFVSSPGKHDGLYWQSSGNEGLSPLGPLLTAAVRDADSARSDRQLAPYHGYYYRILTKQGKDAPGGAYDYIVHGKMLGGFAVVAYPAHYGKSGVMTFMVNHDGKVYEKDLGIKTAELASGIKEYNPDSSWKLPAG